MFKDHKALEKSHLCKHQKEICLLLLYYKRNSADQSLQGTSRYCMAYSSAALYISHEMLLLFNVLAL